MNNLPERTIVKKSAAEIGDIIKELKTSRIKITKANTAAVNKEHDAIVERLELANKPFTDLIDEYNVKRKKVLADEKRVVELRAAMIQKEADHEMGLLINKTFEYDKAEELRLQTERDDQIRKQATIDAEARQKLINEVDERARVNEENARLANKEHFARVNRTILAYLLGEGFDAHEARKFIKLAAQNKLPQLTINY